MVTEATTQDQIMINSPEVRLENIDFQSSYLNQTLDIGRLRFRSPSIGFVQHITRESVENNLQVIRDAITQLPQRIKIETIEIHEADIDLDLAESSTREIRFDVDFILIQGFSADSSTTFSEIDHLPFQKIQLYLSNIRQDLNTQIGQLNIQRAQLNSSQQQIILEGLEIGDPALQQLLIQNGQLHIKDKLEVQEYDYQGNSIRLNAQAASWSRIVPSFSCLGPELLSPHERSG